MHLACAAGGLWWVVLGGDGWWVGDWVLGCLAAWLLSCSADWLLCCLAAWVLGCLGGWLVGWVVVVAMVHTDRLCGHHLQVLWSIRGV